MRIIWRLLGLLKRYWFWTLVSMILLVGATLMQLAVPEFLKRAIDAGVSGWKIYIIATGTILLGGSGVLMANNIAKADFSQVSPPTISFATGNNQKAVYQLGRLPSLNSRSMTITLGTPVKFNFAGHGFSNNDQVYFTSQVGAAWTASTFAANTKYFVRNAGLNDFELSATFNGASIGAEIGRASCRERV